MEKRREELGSGGGLLWGGEVWMAGSALGGAKCGWLGLLLGGEEWMAGSAPYYREEWGIAQAQ